LVIETSLYYDARSENIQFCWHYFEDFITFPPVPITSGCALDQILLCLSQLQYSRRLAFDYDIYVNFINSFMSVTRHNWMTPRSGFVFEKLTGYQLVKKFPACCAVPKVITVHTTNRHWSISWFRLTPKTSNLQQHPCDNLKCAPWNQWPWLSRKSALRQTSQTK